MTGFDGRNFELQHFEELQRYNIPEIHFPIPSAGLYVLHLTWGCRGRWRTEWESLRHPPSLCCQTGHTLKVHPRPSPLQAAGFVGPNNIEIFSSEMGLFSFPCSMKLDTS